MATSPTPDSRPPHEPTTTPSAHPPANEDNLLESLGKAISAPLRDDPDTDTDEKPEAPPTR